MQHKALNEIAALLNTTDKNLVISVAIKTLIDAGTTPTEAIDTVLGKGTRNEIANTLWKEATA